MNTINTEHMSILRLTGPQERGFNELYDIYGQTIAVSEQKPRHAIEAMAENKNYRLFIAVSGQNILGFSIFYVPDAKDFALLEYMAVRKDKQREGIGSKLFHQSANSLEESAGHCPILMEIDSDREEHATDYAIRLRRIRFYTALGCRRIRGLNYIMPEVGNGPPPQMDLYVYESNPSDTVAKTDLERWLTTIYREVYSRPQDDPRIKRMLVHIDDPAYLERISPKTFETEGKTQH